uniref:site-specific integrase n=1 Tax=Solidesulfovibrio fructosivorans TaxID=878 RepID=UPI002351AB12|nr:site-specific integrase [Solidesulfovibrio fructosivorans]
MFLTTKNSEARKVPLAEGALTVLRELPRSLDQGPVFGLLPDQITASMKYACKKAKLENLRFHDLRHEATSRLFELTDLGVMEIKAITGHKTLQMLARYTHLRTARLADRLAGMKRGMSTL